MKATHFFAAAILSGLASQATATTLLGPKGRFTSLIYDLEWSPGNACYKPLKPFRNDKYEWEIYRNNAVRYLDCLKSAARNDAEYAAEKVSEGYKKAADEFLDEVRSRY